MGTFQGKREKDLNEQEKGGTTDLFFFFFAEDPFVFHRVEGGTFVFVTTILYYK